MTVTTRPAQGNTAWYGHYSDLDSVARESMGGAIIVASSEAPADVKVGAHYICDGTADNVQINSAITQATTAVARGGNASGEQRGRVILTGGQFTLSDPVLMRTGVWLQGQGMLTQLEDDGTVGTGGSGGLPALIKLNDANVHMSMVSDMYLEGNFASGTSGCCGIYYEGSGGGDQSDFPNSDPDTDNSIRQMFIHGFKNAGSTQHGIYINDTQMRGTQISDCNIREITTHAIFVQGPDGHMNNIHIGGVGTDGVRVDGGNWKINNVKAYYCDNYGFNFINTRMVGSCLEAQDCYNGVNLGAADVIVEGIFIDTCDVNALTISGDRVKASFLIMHRSSGRYANTNVGVLFSSTPTGINVQGTINNTDVTTPVSGTYSGTANFVAISHGSTLIRQG